MADWMNVSESSNDITSKPDLNELLVFGYQCKVYRDDEKAKYIDGGKHLIPWMDDPSLYIDRYDGRGHLFNLRPYDSDFTPRNRELSDEEQRIEALCDEERYLELHTDIAEKRLYEEEELKRLNEAVSEGYGAVHFNYDEPEPHSSSTYNPEQPTNTQTDDGSDGEIPFYPSPELQIPCDMIVPETDQHNAVIEKTAEFISKQSTQMEIVIKTKQQHNPKFNFLHHTDSLNPYYQFLVKAIKSGRYKPSQKPKPVQTVQLPPSELAPPVPEMSTREMLDIVKQTLPQSQLQNTSYAKLVKKIAKHNSGRDSPVVSNKYSADLPPGTIPVQLPESKTKPFVGIVDYKSPQKDLQPALVSYSITPSQKNDPDQSILSASTADSSKSLVEQGCQPPPHQETPQNVETKHKLGFMVPNAKQQIIVDGMAKFVVKNGRDFETVVKEKKESRFDFILPMHKYNDYYEYRKAMYEKDLDLGLIEVRPDYYEMVHGCKKKLDKSQSQSNRAISFSIKSKDTEQPSVEVNRKTLALLYESSSDDDDSENGQNKKTTDNLTADITVETAEKQNSKLPNGQATKAPPLKKSAEDRLADRLAVAAKDKLAQANREKQVQAERKRKAAMFLSMLNKTSSVKTAEESTLSSAEVVSLSQNNESKALEGEVLSSKTEKPLPSVSLIEEIGRSVPHSPAYNRSSPAPSKQSNSSRPSPVVSRHSPTPVRRSPSVTHISSSRSSRIRSISPPVRHSISRIKSRSRSPKRTHRRHSRERNSSMSRERKRSMSRERKRSMSRERKRSRSREKKRSRSREKKRSRSRERKRSRSKSRHKSRERRRSRSPRRKHHKKSHSPSRHRKHKKKSHKRSASSPSPSPKKRSLTPDRKHRKRRKHKDSSYVAPPPSEVIDISEDEEAVTIVTTPERISDTADPSPKPSGNSTPRPCAASTLANSKVGKEISQDLLLKVRAMLKASQQPPT